MGHIDVTLKKLLSGGAPEFLASIGLPPEITFLPSEVYEQTEMRVDVLCVESGTKHPFFHAELQAGNHTRMLVRMMRYQAGIANRLIEEDRHNVTRTAPLPHIDQVCVYVGNPTMAMSSEATSGSNRYRFRLVDARTIESEPLIRSGSLNDAVLSVLGRDGATASNLDRVLKRLSVLELTLRSELYSRLLVLAAIRNSQDYVKKRRTEMGIVVDLANVPELQNVYNAGREEGVRSSTMGLVLRLLARKFGEGGIPQGTEAILQDLHVDALNMMLERVHTATDVEDVLDIHTPGAPRLGI